MAKGCVCNDAQERTAEGHGPAIVALHTWRYATGYTDDPDRPSITKNPMRLTEAQRRTLAETIARVVEYKGEILFDLNKPNGAPANCWTCPVCMALDARRASPWKMACAAPAIGFLTIR